MTRNSLLFSIITLIQFWSGHANAQNLSYAWANKAGGGTSEEGKSIQVDMSGNVYVTGYFEGTSDFDPGPNVVNLTSLGGREIFISKYNPDGGLIWAKKIGGTSNDYANNLRLDSIGNLYIIGSFQSSVDFDPNAGTAFLTSSGSDDIFIAKYSPSGVYQWAQKIGSNQSDIGASLEIDGLGNLIVTGYFRGQVDFDPGAGTTNLTSNGGNDAFLAKFTNSGLLIWADNLGGAQDDNGTDLQLDEKGYIYFTGSFQGIADFDPSENTYNLTSNGLKDVFLSCFDASGNFIWANGLGGISDDIGNTLKLGLNGRIYLTGSFQGSMDFDPSANTTILTGMGDEDIFLASYDTLGGTYHWAKAISGISVDKSVGLHIANSEEVYLTGHFSLDCNFEIGTPSATLSSLGGRDIFITCYGLSGEFKWATSIGGTSDDSANAIKINNDGSLYLTGYFRGSVDFDPGPNVSPLSSTSFFDIFIAKYYVCLPVIVLHHPINVVICENTNTYYNVDSPNAVNYSWQFSTDGVTNWIPISDTSIYYIGSNTPSLTIQNANINQNGTFFRVVMYSNCGLVDTSAIASLTVSPVSSSSEFINICFGESYIFPDGTSSDTSSIHLNLLQSINGCDSIIISTLIVNPQYHTEETIEICSGETYVFQDGTMADSTSYHVSSLLSENGCDSLIATNLIVKKVDTSITLDGMTLTALGNDQSVQWVDCDNNYSPILGATNSVYIPSTSGTYAAILSNDNCTDTSVCFLVLISNTHEEDLRSKFKVYPNPANDIIQIEVEWSLLNIAKIKIVNMLGITIYESIMSNSLKELIDTSDWFAGTYYIQITEGTKVVSSMLVKK